MNEFIKLATIGRGCVPILPVELRQLIHKYFVNYDSFICLRCSKCPKVLAMVSTNHSFESLLNLERLCIDCYECV